MASDDLRARIAAAIWERQNPGGSYADEMPRWRADAEADADAVMAVVQPELDRLTTELAVAQSGLVYADRDGWRLLADRTRERAESAEAERDKALAALQAVREAQSLGEALAAVAKHDGLTTDQPTTKETLS